METVIFAAMLVPPFQPSAEWAEGLAESLLHPQFPISNLEAMGRQLRRIYFYIYSVIGAAWLAKLWLYPTTSSTWSEVIRRAAIGDLDGFWTILVVGIFYIGLTLLSLGTARLQQAAGEVLPRFGSQVDLPIEETKTADRAWFRPSHRRKQLLTLIITDRPEQVSERVTQDMRRGVTAISGVGMFTGKSHQVLLCAFTVTEVPQLKHLVKLVDPNAFIIVSPAQEIFGRGFQSLKDEA